MHKANDQIVNIATINNQSDLRRFELDDFFFIFAQIILMVFQVYLYKKNIPHRDCSEIGTISNYVFNKVFFL